MNKYQFKRKIKDFLDIFQYDLPHLSKNLWWFRKEIWSFRPWDYSYNLSLFARSLSATANCIEKGDEIKISASKKVAKIHRAIELMNLLAEHDSFPDEQKYLNEICQILKGQDDIFNFDLDKNIEEQEQKYFEWYDGSGILHWWE